MLQNICIIKNDILLATFLQLLYISKALIIAKLTSKTVCTQIRVKYVKTNLKSKYIS